MASPRPPLPIVARLLATPDCACPSCVAKREAAGLIEALTEVLEAAKVEHHNCWYPLAICNCGADAHNAAIDAALARARQEIA